MKHLKKIHCYIQRIVLFFLASTILCVLLYRWCPVYVTPLMVIRCVQQVNRGEEIRMKHHWIPLDSMSVFMPIAVMASEDQRFMQHHGFDFVEIEKAWNDYRSGIRKRGASSISQQTAKNVFLWNGGGWFRKIMESYFTILIEVIWGKERIMEVYLNSIEMGNGIYGVEAVSQQHFGRSSIELTQANCALIAATLPNPLEFSSKTPSPYILKRQTKIMKEMKFIGEFSSK